MFVRTRRGSEQLQGMDDQLLEPLPLPVRGVSYFRRCPRNKRNGGGEEEPRHDAERANERRSAEGVKNGGGMARSKGGQPEEIRSFEVTTSVRVCGMVGRCTRDGGAPTTRGSPTDGGGVAAAVKEKQGCGLAPSRGREQCRLSRPVYRAITSRGLRTLPPPPNSCLRLRS